MGDKASRNKVRLCSPIQHFAYQKSLRESILFCEQPYDIIIDLVLSAIPYSAFRGLTPNPAELLR